MNDITQLDFDGKDVRIVDQNGDVWFVLKDVLAAMGSSTRPAIAKTSIEQGLGDGCVSTAQLQTSGGTQNITIISEAALVFLSLRSNSAKSKAVVSSIVAQISDSKAIIRALQDFEVPDDLPDMYVYAIREKDSGRIKLGISKNPESRVKQLQTGNSSVLELLAYRKAENRFCDESNVHFLNKDHHVRGEWFDGNARLVSFQ